MPKLAHARSLSSGPRAVRSRGAVRALLLVVPLVGLVELGLHFWFAKRPPTFEEWGAVGDVVPTFAPASAPIVVAPRWAEPLARKALGDDRMPLAHVARSDTSRFERAVEVSILGERAPELAGWIEERSVSHGKFHYRLLRNPKHRPVITDFVERARPPTAEAFLTEPAEPCRWNAHARPMSGGLGGNPTFPAERFECAGGPFISVGVTVIADEQFVARRCLWSHPPRVGEIVTRFRSVPLGATIEGHSGMYWMIERERKGAPVTIAVRVDGDEIGKIEHHDGEGWAGFELPLGAHANKAAATVEFGVSSRNYQHRHFCFEATSR